MLKYFIFLLLTSSIVFSQTTVNLPTVNVSADATASINLFLPEKFSGNNTTLTSSVGVGDTTLNVATTTGIGTSNMLIRIDDEVLTVTAKTINTLTVTRASIGTAAANHSNGIVVRELQYKSFASLFLALIREQVAEIMELKPTGAITTQNSVVSTAQAAKQAAKLNSIQ